MTITGHRSSRKPHRALLLSLLALGALGLVACGGGDGDETAVAPETGTELSPEQKIEQAGNEWAPLFAAHDPAACRFMAQPACEQLNCQSVSGPIENCTHTPPPSEFRQSFADATVQDVAFSGNYATARFSNGEAVEFFAVRDALRCLGSGCGDGAERDRLAPWLIFRVGRNEGDVALIMKVGNAWAPLFAEDNSAACEFMFGQPLCEEFFGRVGEPPEVGRPSGFQESFANATVERVEVKEAKQIRAKDGTPIELHKGAAEFSNGEVVEFIEETDAPRSDLGKWFVDDVGNR